MQPDPEHATARQDGGPSDETTAKMQDALTAAENAISSTSAMTVRYPAPAVADGATAETMEKARKLLGVPIPNTLAGKSAAYLASLFKVLMTKEGVFLRIQHYDSEKFASVYMMSDSLVSWLRAATKTSFHLSNENPLTTELQLKWQLIDAGAAVPMFQAWNVRITPAVYDYTDKPDDTTDGARIDNRKRTAQEAADAVTDELSKGIAEIRAKRSRLNEQRQALQSGHAALDKATHARLMREFAAERAALLAEGEEFLTALTHAPAPAPAGDPQTTLDQRAVGPTTGGTRAAPGAAPDGVGMGTAGLALDDPLLEASIQRTRFMQVFQQTVPSISDVRGMTFDEINMSKVDTVQFYAWFDKFEKTLKKYRVHGVIKMPLREWGTSVFGAAANDDVTDSIDITVQDAIRAAVKGMDLIAIPNETARDLVDRLMQAPSVCSTSARHLTEDGLRRIDAGRFSTPLAFTKHVQLVLTAIQRMDKCVGEPLGPGLLTSLEQGMYHALRQAPFNWFAAAIKAHKQRNEPVHVWSVTKLFNEALEGEYFSEHERDTAWHDLFAAPQRPAGPGAACAKDVRLPAAGAAGAAGPRAGAAPTQPLLTHAQKNLYFRDRCWTCWTRGCKNSRGPGDCSCIFAAQHKKKMCNKCGWRGHIAESCDMTDKYYLPAFAATLAMDANGDLGTSERGPRQLRTRDAAIVIREEQQQVHDTPHPAEPVEWCIDGGANRHMTPYISDFSSIHRIPTPLPVTVADNTKITATHVGDIHVTVQGFWPLITLAGALLVPDLSTRLVSPTLLSAADHRIQFSTFMGMQYIVLHTPSCSQLDSVHGTCSCDGAVVAQWLRRRASTVEVVGSNPTGGDSGIVFL
ncbi:hypothetical protein BCR44DRAFT_1487012 [Catenaria anguillulae PL171]|uniref:CCHC-type domain-containing protein n=1 Tax=Catenaria anguillulae PL171 TaxID=765915 RepID=A0A1Y2HFK4_9FUNG|nr:hypothetical protein BCR44DRAFT_1487012 [Catenaria anguillulae PL171]